MACTRTNNVRIEPCDVSWQIEEQSCVEFVAQADGDYDGTSLLLPHPDGTILQPWFDLDNASVAPTPAPGATLLEVNVTTGQSANAIATAFAAAVHAHAKYTATADGMDVTVTVVGVGDCDPAEDVDSGLLITRLQEGGSLDMGLTDGDTELSFEEQTSELTSHQTGLTPLADLRQGNSVEVTLTLKESDLPKLKQIFARNSGGSHTPMGGTELFGWGSSRQGLNTIVQARRMIFHPVNLATSDRSRDLCLWKTYLIPDTLVYSGENPMTVSVGIKIYLDETKPEEISMLSFGDWTQLIPA